MNHGLIRIRTSRSRGPLVIRVSPSQPQLKLQNLHQRIQFVGHSVKTMRSLYYVCGLHRVRGLTNVENSTHQTQTVAETYSVKSKLSDRHGLYKELGNHMSDPLRTNVLNSQFSNCTDFTFFYILSRVHWVHMTPLSPHFHVLRPFKAPHNDAPSLLFHGIEVQIAHQRTEQRHEGNLKIGIA